MQDLEEATHLVLSDDAKGKEGLHLAQSSSVQSTNLLMHLFVELTHSFPSVLAKGLVLMLHMEQSLSSHNSPLKPPLYKHPLLELTQVL